MSGRDRHAPGAHRFRTMHRPTCLVGCLLAGHYSVLSISALCGWSWWPYSEGAIPSADVMHHVEVHGSAAIGVAGCLFLFSQQCTRSSFQPVIFICMFTVMMLYANRVVFHAHYRLNDRVGTSEQWTNTGCMRCTRQSTLVYSEPGSSMSVTLLSSGWSPLRRLYGVLGERAINSLSCVKCGGGRWTGGSVHIISMLPCTAYSTGSEIQL